MSFRPTWLILKHLRISFTLMRLPLTAGRELSEERVGREGRKRREGREGRIGREGRE